VNEWWNRVYLGSCERMSEIPDASVDSVVTSPPYYGLREYDHDEQIGHEPTMVEYIDRMLTVFREVRRTLRDDGTAWVNIGDSYAGSWGAQGRSGAMSDRSVVSARQIATHPHNASQTGTIRDAGIKPKDLRMIPFRLAIALQEDGWWVRDLIAWAKPNPMPSSVTDRCTSSWETVIMLSKSRTYYADMDAVREPLAPATLDRIKQAKWKSGEQVGSDRANGGAKTNGPMRAVVRPNGPKPPSQIEDNPDAYNMAGANLRNVWTIPTTPYLGDHPAVMPRALATRCIVMGTPPGGIVLDPFMGSGTVAECAVGNGRNYVGYEINPQYHEEIAKRLGLFGGAA
jgi:DNA modification methylase